MGNEKRIEMVVMKVGDLKTTFGNPRKIKKKDKDELRESFERNGDFGIFLINETDEIIAGNQRAAVLREMNPDTEVYCKRLIGYTVSELRAINIKDNVHAGEWDLEMLAEWTADLNIDLGLDLDNADPVERKIDDMELIRYEKYDYVMLVCKTEIDYNDLIRKLGIEGRKVAITNKRKIKARAVWYDKVRSQIIEKPLDEQVTEGKEK